MKHRSLALLPTLAVLMLAACLAPAITRAEGEPQRMVKRAPKVRSLKDAGHIGETHEGLLAVKVTSKEATETVNAENADRTAVYKEIAAKQKVNWKLVGTRRFLQLKEQARPGDWLLTEDGKWHQK